MPGLPASTGAAPLCARASCCGAERPYGRRTLCTGETYKAVVKLTFAHGAALADPAGLFNASLEGATRRAKSALRRRAPLPALGVQARKAPWCRCCLQVLLS
jgi:hypothetical protein